MDMDLDNGSGGDLGREHDVTLIVTGGTARVAVGGDVDRVYSDAVMGGPLELARVVGLRIERYGQDGCALAYDDRDRPWVRDSLGEWSEADCVPA